MAITSAIWRAASKWAKTKLSSPRTTGATPRTCATRRFRGDDPALKNGRNLSPRWVHVFAIDHFGACTLLYPGPERGNEGNRQPYSQFGEQPKFDPLIALPGGQYDFSIAKPFGVDSYFLLSTQGPIDPAVFNAEGVRTRGGTRGAPADPLSEMLAGSNTGTRAAKRVETPGTWSIESLTIRSVGKDR